MVVCPPPQFSRTPTKLGPELQTACRPFGIERSCNGCYITNVAEQRLGLALGLRGGAPSLGGCQCKGVGKQDCGIRGVGGDAVLPSFVGCGAAVCPAIRPAVSRIHPRRPTACVAGAPSR